ncbi:hypothetical protein C8F04DRAFT_1093806 [Mycena alexandri]|uniref:Uncharacterized protein n=1 Tax=Mycena alexandri TaxID=1745969 RepID=A0AAD6X6N0_9AGAR|nr:hypothetical protein C8F04DRAFT_1093806 [Mycena alexandri]
MFAGSHHFTVAGGTFNNIMKSYHAAPNVAPDFRMIPMGDIDLQQELMVNEKSGVVGRRRARNSVRRVYSATIDGRNSNVTVATYEGDDAEKDWRRDTEMYMSFRHPNIIQICGGASCGNIHATVFHGDLVPLEAFLARQSPIMTVYLYGCYDEEWIRVNNYFKSLRRDLNYYECTLWIRTSTGRLSVDPVPPDTRTELVLHSGYTADETSPRQTATPSGPSNTEVLAIESLALRQYHRICSLCLSRYRVGSISTSTTVNIGAAISWPSRHQYKEHVQIASLGKLDIYYNSWSLEGHGAGDVAGNGWSRYVAAGVCNTEIMLEVYSYDSEGWLSQANHVFSRLQITCDLEDYGLVANTYFTITIGNAGKGLPPGYLFLCPKEDFQTRPSSFSWPNCPAYWSVDPSGVKRLSTEEATHLGFPPIQLATKVAARSWDASVYAGLRKFHQTKRFDPESQDVALYLGEPLFRLSRDANSPFAHAEEISADGEANTVNRNRSSDGGNGLYGQLTEDAPTDSTGVPALEESQIVSRGFRFTMNVQLTLIFLSLCWMYGQVCSRGTL